MKNKLLFLVIFFYLGIMNFNVYADETLNGFVNIDGNQYYYVDGTFLTGVQEIDGNYFYFGEDGKMQYGVTDGTYYYGRLSGTRQYNYWWDIDKDGKMDYYFDGNGKIVDGIKYIDGNYYYFINNKKQYAVTDGTYYYGRLSGSRQYNYYWSQNFDNIINYYFGSDGKMVKNTWKDIDFDNKYDYYFGSDGKTVDGVQEIDGNYYYFINNKKQYEATDETYYYGRLTGTRQYNYWWDIDKDGKYDYYFGLDGKAVNGVQEIDGSYYYFINNKKQYEATDGTYYYGRLTGTRQYNYWWDIDKDGKYDYYFGLDGKAVNGVQEIDGNYYYFINNKKQYEATDGTYYYGRLTGTRQYNYWWDIDKDGQVDYYFGTDGIQLKNTWYDYNQDGKTDYYFELDGKVVNGVQEIEGNYYYFVDYIKQYGVTDGNYYYGKQSGTRQYNYWWDYDQDGKTDYYFGTDGAMVYGVQEIDSKNYYFDLITGKMQYGIFIELDGKTYYYGKISGTRQFGWLSSYGSTYYFDKNTGEMATGNVTIDEVTYQFNDNGIWQAGWVLKDNKRYYYYTDGTMATGWVTIAGLKCYFNELGELIQEGALKIIDVSAHQGIIDWNLVSNNTDVDKAIIRLGYGTSYITDSPVIDGYFYVNYNETYNNDLLFGVYLYSYAIDAVSASIEAEFVINLLNQQNYDKNKVVYYDLESNSWTKNLSSSDYDIIISTFVDKLSRVGYKVQVYTYKYLAETKFSDYAKSQLGWIAQYNSNCTYNGTYSGWQYTDKGSVFGINGSVDISMWKK